MSWLRYGGEWIEEEPVVPITDTAPPREATPGPSAWVDLLIQGAESHGLAVEAVAAGFHALPRHLVRYDATGLGRVRVLAHVSAPLASGAVFAAQYVPASTPAPAEGNWAYLDGMSGPTVSLGLATPTPQASAVAHLADGAQQDIVIRGVIVGADGTATTLGVRSLRVQVAGEFAEPEDPDNPIAVNEPFTEGVGAWVLHQNCAGGGAYSDGTSGSLTIEAHFGCGLGFGGGYYYLERTDQLEPNTDYHLSGRWRMNQAPSFGPVGMRVNGQGVNYQGSGVEGSFSYDFTTGANGQAVIQLGLFDIEVGFPHLALTVLGFQITGGTGEVVIGPTAGPAVAAPPLQVGDTPPALPLGDRFLFSYDLPPDVINVLAFDTSGRSMNTGTLLDDLAEAEARGGRILGTQGGYNKFKTGGVYDRDRMYSFVRSFSRLGVQVKRYYDAGVFVGWQAVDDHYNAQEWGRVLSGRDADEICGWIKEIWPWCPTCIRATPSRMGEYKPIHIDFLIAQYSRRFGDLATWVAAEQARGPRIGVSNILWSLNVINGGLASGAPTNMSAAQVEQYGEYLAATAGGVGVGMWKYMTANLNKPGMQAAWVNVRNQMAP